MITKEHIAKVCHEANKAYCESLGDFSQFSWDEAPEWQRASVKLGVDLHCRGDFGAEASHAAWMNHKIDDGWVYGLEKDAVMKTHPCLVPFSMLTLEQRAKDYLFRSIVHILRNLL